MSHSRLDQQGNFLFQLSPVVAKRGRGVVWSAAGEEVAVRSDVVFAALASPAEKVGGALADAAHAGALVRALSRVLDITLQANCILKQRF